ncbi:MAG: NADH-quinone oxidoreductase subunit M [Alphaproteobacteria bacterium MarineAlpha9_Bin4]|nr:NADH-quinone oxidoreductase subunit M [Pelagibacterales bacterium]PPR27531.1 MAG: NADH-quinone oxidoreductase subunit M [Alphaproteobacteria bacterium MarineAlpha9_Bin4]
MITFPLLSTIIIVPLIGAIIAFLIKGDEANVSKNLRELAIWTSLVVLVISIIILLQFDLNSQNFQFIEKKTILSKFDISYHLGVDSVSLIFILLTTTLFPICFLYSKLSIKFRTREFVIAMLALEALTLGVFCSLDIVLFYIFFESLLIPMFLIIGIWGGKNRIFSSFKFFLYTLAGSVFFLISIIFMAYTSNTTSIPQLDNYYFDVYLQKWLWFGMFLSFAIKVPMWPFHTWLPDAHVEAPTIGSMILAGVLLKVGAFAFLRISLPILPEASIYFSSFIMTLSAIAVVYTSIVAFAQTDIKKLIAYSSVAHMGYVTAGIFSISKIGIQGSLFQMISHGIVSAGLFLSIGLLYERTKSRIMDDYNLIIKSMPIFSLFFIVLVLSSVGLPGTSGFIGELLVVIGVFKNFLILGFIISSGIILGAVYMMSLVRKIIFTGSNSSTVTELTDLNVLEILLMLFLVFFTLLLGLFPNIILNITETSVIEILKNFN